MRKLVVVVVLLLMASLSGCSKTDSSSTPNAEVSAEQARAIAKEAYIYGFPMVDSYRVQYSYFVDRNNPEYKGDWNQIHNTARVATPCVPSPPSRSCRRSA